MSELITPPYADRQLFSLHEEEEVTEVTPHRRQVVYFETSLRGELSDRFVAANLGVYWVPGQYEEPWAGPDVLVAARPPLRDPQPRVWLVWEDGPLQFVGEVASEKTRRLERRKREEKYQDALAVPEYLYVDLDRHQLELWRLQAGRYRRVREQGGRLYSEALGVWFGWQPGMEFVRIWTADGRMLPTEEEREQQRQEAEQRAQEQQRRRQAAEQRADEEARARQAAEQRADEEAQARQAAEQRADEEAQARQAAEARAAALAAELARLRGGGA